MTDWPLKTVEQGAGGGMEQQDVEQARACTSPRYVLRGRRWPAAGAAQPVPSSLRKGKPAGAVRTCPKPPQPCDFSE